MSSRALVDPELLPLVDKFQGFEVSTQTLGALRELTREMLPMLASPATEKVTRVERHIPGPPGAPAVRVLVYSPTHAHTGRPAMIYMHGGGHVSGFAESCDARCTLLAKELGCVVVSVDYRLAPETIFPGSLEDCYAVLQWLQVRAVELRIDATRIAVGGESAGGGLAAALALLARDRGAGALAFQLLIYPMLDDRTGSTSMVNSWAGEFVWTAGSNRHCWTSLLGHAPGGSDVAAYAAPARAADLSGLPPAFIAIGALDLFVDESIDYAQRLMRAGVSTELHVYPGAVHGFDLVPTARATVDFESQYRTALRRAFHSARAGDS
jgi:acetyl esterase/lipase